MSWVMGIPIEHETLNRKHYKVPLTLSLQLNWINVFIYINEKYVIVRYILIK